MPAVLPPTAVPPHLSHLYTSRLKPTDDPVLRYIDAEKLDAVYHPVADSPLWDPFNHKDGHKGASKKAYIQVCGLDPLRDEGVLYEARLRDAGVETKLELYKGRCHMFWTNWPEMEASKKFWEDYVQGARWLLE